MSFVKKRRAVIKEEYVAITGDFELALILNQFIYWSSRVKDADLFIKEENIRRKHEKLEEMDLNCGWIYKTMEELTEELMTGWSRSKVSRLTKKLIDLGYISRRNNPKYKWDKTYQYRVNLNNVVKALWDQGYTIDEFKIDMAQALKSPSSQNETSRDRTEPSELPNKTAIPKTTTKTTSKDIKEYSSAEAKPSIPYKGIIEYLNKKADRQFNYKARKNRSLIKARVNEGYTEKDFYKVIDVKVKDWLGNPTMEQYLRPSTLFSNKFDQYLNEASTAPTVSQPSSNMPVFK